MRKNIRELRRRELIDATCEIIEESGFESATISKIANRAGFSIGFIHHHFKNKDDLLAETMMVLYGDMPKFLVEKLSGKTDPVERLHLIFEANFRPDQFNKRNAYAWASYLVRVPFHPEFVRLQRVLIGRLRSNLRHELRQLLPTDKVADAVEELTALIDGHWVRLASGTDIATSERVIMLMKSALRRIVNDETGTTCHPS